MVDVHQAEPSDRRRGARLGLTGQGGHGQAGQGLHIPAIRHPWLRQRVRSIVHRSSEAGSGSGVVARGRSRLGLTGRSHLRAPVTRWPGLGNLQGQLSFRVMCLVCICSRL